MAEMNFDGVVMNAVVSVPANMNFDGVTVNAVTRLAGPTQFKRTPRVELLEALTATTGVALDPTKYDIGEVVNDTPVTARATIDLIALEASGKRRTTPVVYRRRNIYELINTLDLDLLKPTTAFPITNLTQLVDAFNRTYGLTLANKDFKPLIINQGGPTTIMTALASWYFEPNTQVAIGRLDGTDREFELLLKGLTWPTKTLPAQQAYFVKDTFRAEFNKLFGDTFTAPQTQIPDVSAPSTGPTTNREREVALVFTVGQTVTNKKVYFFRLSLTDLPGQLIASSVWDLQAGKFLDAGNVTELATMAGLPLDALEFVNTDLVETTPQGPINVTFKATDNSKFFKGEVTISVPRAPWVTTIVPNGTTFSL
jgi:hypothetical protein